MKGIYPLYVISLLISLPNLLFFSKGNVWNAVVKFTLDLTLLQSIFGSTRFSHGINGVCWFLSTLFLCYILAPSMITLVRIYCKNWIKIFLAMFFSFCLILILFFLFDQIKIRNSFFDDLFYGTVYVRGLYFLLGMLLAEIYFQTKILKYADFIEFLTIVACLIWFLLRNRFSLLVANDLLLVLPIDFFVLVMCFSFAYGQGWFSKKMAQSSFLVKWGGTYGMYLYLLHYPVRKTVDGIFQKMDLGTGTNVVLFEIVLILLFTLGLTFLFKIGLESMFYSREK